MNPITWLVSHMMVPTLDLFHAWTGSYGWAIILLTVTIKMALMPLTIQQFRSMQAMARLQPKIKELQEKYKDKPEELNKRVLEFYRENKFNPFGGCLPLLIQMPFLIALYMALISTEFTKKTHESFYFIHDLARTGMTGKEGLYYDNIGMLIFYGITTYVSQKMVTTNPNDPMQKQMMIMMPIIITLTFVSFPVPSGIFLYLVISNAITIGQYLIMGSAGMLPAKVAVVAGPAVGGDPDRANGAAPQQLKSADGEPVQAKEVPPTRKVVGPPPIKGDKRPAKKAKKRRR